MLGPTTETWKTVDDMPLAVAFNPSHTRLPDGRTLIHAGSFSSFTERAFLFDPSTDSWSEAALSLEPRRGGGMAKLGDGRVLFAGGFGGADVLGTAEICDPDVDEWAPAADMPSGGFSVAMSLPDGRVLMAVFADGASVHIYDPETDSWAWFEAPVATAGAMLPDGRVVFVVGGGGLGGVETEAYIFNTPPK